MTLVTKVGVRWQSFPAVIQHQKIALGFTVNSGPINYLILSQTPVCITASATIQTKATYVIGTIVGKSCAQ